mgnify:CR=1 FL=1
MTAIEEVNLKTILPSNGPSIQEVKKYLEKYTDEKIVIKCGGSVLIDPNLFNLFISDVVVMKKLGLTPTIVHGGGKRINNKLKELNIESNFIKGLRVTDNNTIKIVEDVLIEFNKEIVNALKNKSCDARSITTKEYNIILVKPERGELGFVGIPTEININVLDEIIKANEIILQDLGDENIGFSIKLLNVDSAATGIKYHANQFDVDSLFLPGLLLISNEFKKDYISGLQALKNAKPKTVKMMKINDSRLNADNRQINFLNFKSCFPSIVNKAILNNSANKNGVTPN